ncbi:hypothetical protein T492DRAFT_897909 [Pavlovales sp. CCMP2436]|nr:hypothetical protein T492DRAFT_897909 [Pavlovales sp. CCMP2436]
MNSVRTKWLSRCGIHQKKGEKINEGLWAPTARPRLKSPPVVIWESFIIILILDSIVIIIIILFSFLFFTGGWMPAPTARPHQKSPLLISALVSK